jgi:hypothetical protein
MNLNLHLKCVYDSKESSVLIQDLELRGWHRVY